ncbi:MAG TPA: DUF1570 domain-containing protein, partial [Gemmatales bacterium]|nr:DUF1570 domain-containing protein [Gemmatales bacterium]HMP17111.1 DUF1570 domain-containing protein [Gemmatales bacterium]
MMFLLLLVIAPQESVKPAFDQLILQHGARVEGLLLEETPQQVRFQFLLKKPGVRTLVFETTYHRSEIAKIIKATEPGRTYARQLFDKLSTSSKNEEEAVSRIQLHVSPWIEGEKQALVYRGNYFELLSDAPKPLIQFVAFRLEQMFAAYLGILGKRVEPVKPLRILLFGSITEYRLYQQKKGITLLSPAVYDVRNMEIIMGTDLPAQQKELQTLKKQHALKLSELQQQRKSYFRHYGGQLPAILAKQLEQLQQQLQQVDSENEATYALAQQQFFSVVYHEAFHAYLDNWVFPSEQYSVPRWLNEGLAQLFENAFIEIDELRIGRIEDKRLVSIQDAVRAGRFMSIRELIQAPMQQFLVRHTSDQFEVDRYYQASWALAHYLNWELKLLNSSAMLEYVSRSDEDQPLQRFEKLVGMSIPQCQEQWYQYLLRLRADGTLRP